MNLFSGVFENPLSTFEPILNMLGFILQLLLCKLTLCEKPDVAMMNPHWKLWFQCWMGERHFGEHSLYITMKQLRHTIQQQRLSLTIPQQNQFSLAIAQQLFELSIFQKSQHIACYLPHKAEVNTDEIIQTIWRLNKHCYLPIINSDRTLSFAEYTAHTALVPNKFGILQPNLQEAIDKSAQELDLVITPLVCFNDERFRVGWGLGHYDRTFAFLLKKNRPTKPFLLGLAYNFQHCEDISIHNWDVPLDLIITEKRLY